MRSSDYIAILEKHEPAAVRFVENIVWASADNFRITDVDGVTRLDFSSGAMITNSGHNNAAIIQAIERQLHTGIYSTYLFPNLQRCSLHQTLARIIPNGYQALFLSTGSEAVETAIKVARINAGKR